MRKKIVGLSFIVVMIIGLITVNGMISASENESNVYKGKEKNSVDKRMEMEIETNEEEFNPEPVLTKKGRNTPEYTSNFYIGRSHIASASLVNKTSFNNGGKPLDDEQYQSTLETILEDFNDIKTVTEEQQKKIDKVKSLIKKAIEKNATKGDEVLVKINDEIKKLDKYYNGGSAHEEIEVDDTGVPINPDDRVPHYDYSQRGE